MTKVSYPKLHSFKLKSNNVERHIVNHVSKEDNPYLTLKEVLEKEGITSVTIIYQQGNILGYRTSRNTTPKAVYDMQSGILLAMDVLK